MRDEEAGLAWRLRFEAERISSQHAKLDWLYEDLRREFARDGRDSAMVSFARMRDHLEAHFEVEDRVYFPAVHGFRPDHASLLHRLSSQHAFFRSALSEIGERFASTALRDVEASVSELVDSLLAHERDEQALIDEIEASNPDDPSA